MPSFRINPDKYYGFPSDLSIVPYKGKYLVIAPRAARWIVLENHNQINVLEFLMKGHTIKEALDNPELKGEDISVVITQVEARRLCDNASRSITEDKRSLHIYLTNKCNLSCPHCYMFSGKQNDNELSTEEIIGLITDYATVAAGNRITISGGEPTIHNDFDKIVKTASGLGLEINLLTNGSLLSESRINFLSKFISSIQISIDGFSEESDAIIRGAGHFEKALHVVDRFVNQGIETSVAITPTLEMLRKHHNEYAEFARVLAMKYLGKAFKVKFAEGLSPGRNVNPTKDSNKEYETIVNRINKKLYGNDFDLIQFVETMRNDVIVDNCMFGVFAVASNGDVYFCPEIGSLPKIANIRTSSFQDIFEQSLAAEKATSISNLNPCNQCDICNICGGGCRIKEFPELTKRKTFSDIDFGSIPQRKCSVAIKNKFYDLMVRSNEYLFVPLTVDKQ